MKNTRMACTILLAAGVSLAAQDVNQSGPYQGTSNPPPDSTITTQDTTQVPRSKPSPAHRATNIYAPVPQSDQDRDNQIPQPLADDPQSSAPAQYSPASAYPAPVQAQALAQPMLPAQPALTDRRYLEDPDGDIVHPQGRPDELIEGTTIRARLLDSLSTTSSQSGDAFRAEVASDVFQNGQILIPAGSEIDGVVVSASPGRTGGHGSMLLRPQSVILSSGQSYKFHAQVSGTPGSKTKVQGEGVISPDSRLTKDEIEYGGTVGVGVLAGAVFGGPVGALAGGMVGAGVVTVHLLVNRPQATLEPGTVLLFTLTEPLDLVAAGPSSGN